jgi:hypothetical protein
MQPGKCSVAVATVKQRGIDHVSGYATGQPYRYAGNVAQRNSARPKASCTIARAYFMAYPDGGMRTYNAAGGDESSLKS